MPQSYYNQTGPYSIKDIIPRGGTGAFGPSAHAAQQIINIEVAANRDVRLFVKENNITTAFGYGAEIAATGSDNICGAVC